jgi:tetratricopeptide (TPR) repeat protein
MLDKILKFLSENKDALGILFGSGIILAILGGIYKISLWLVKEIRNRKTRSDENFPFKIIYPNSNVAKEILGGEENNFLADRNIPYEQRVMGRNIRREIEDLLNLNRWVLITGKTGIGKTREAINVAESLCKEGWTILYLTREKWLSAPSRLPNGVPERKVLFFLDDLNRKMYASHVEQVPRTEDSLLQPLTTPLQIRLYETLKVFESLCGRHELLVIGTVRDEKFNDFVDEPSEWEKLELKKYNEFWEKFIIYALPEADDNAEINLLNDAVRIAKVKADPSEFITIAKRNDGTFANLVENLRTVHNKNETLRASIFRDTLKGTWEERYCDATTRKYFAKYFFDAVELARAVGLGLTFQNVLSIANIISGKDPTLLDFIHNKRLLQDLIRTQNILEPKDGQIEAKGYRIDIRKYLPQIYFEITHQFYMNISQGSNWSFIFDFMLRAMPKRYFIKDKISSVDHILKQFLPIPEVLDIVGMAYLHFGFYDQAIILSNKSIHLKKGSILSTIMSKIQSLFIHNYSDISQRNLAEAYLGKNRYDDAIIVLKKALEGDPKSVLFWTGLGNALIGSGKIADAINAYNKVLEIDPKSSDSWNAIGIALIQSNEYGDAIKAFNKALEINPTSQVFWYNLAYSYSIQGKYEEALEIYQKAIEELPHSSMLHARIAGTLFRLGHNQEACDHISISKPLIQANDEYTYAAFESLSGNLEHAIELLTIAMEKKIVSIEWARHDPDFENISETVQFKELLGIK